MQDNMLLSRGNDLDANIALYHATLKCRMEVITDELTRLPQLSLHTAGTVRGRNVGARRVMQDLGAG